MTTGHRPDRPLVEVERADDQQQQPEVIGLADRDADQLAEQAETDKDHRQDPAPSTEREQTEDADDRGDCEYDVDALRQDRRVLQDRQRVHREVPDAEADGGHRDGIDDPQRPRRSGRRSATGRPAERTPAPPYPNPGRGPASRCRQSEAGGQHGTDHITMVCEADGREASSEEGEGRRDDRAA